MLSSFSTCQMSNVCCAMFNVVTYYYVVSAVNTAGESPNSNQASARPK